MHNKVSIIIPVFNAEDHIAACIESLLIQSLQECEFIFINDGSQDHSARIIASYQNQDSRIVLINQDNQGVSMARNAGLKLATGQYIGFVDADDVVENDMFATLYQAAAGDECDVVISNFESEIGSHTVVTSYPFPQNILLRREDIDQHLMPYFIKSDDCNTVCTKLFKRKVIVEHNLYFPEKVALGEDGVFNIQYFCVADTVKYLNYIGYHYKETRGSATRNIVQKDYFQRAIEVYCSELPEMVTLKFNNAEINRLKSIRFMNTVTAIIHIYLQSTSEMAFGQRYSFVRNVVNSSYVRDALPIYWEQEYDSLGRYQKLIMMMIRRRNTFVLYLATRYSRLRNT